MSVLDYFDSVRDISYGKSPGIDAWILHFMSENNIEYTIDPRSNASPEQLRFMVSLPEDKLFVPCSDETLELLVQPDLSRPLLDSYLGKWQVLTRLARGYVGDDYLRRRIVMLCRHKFRQTLASNIVIPSRLMKRMTTIFLTQSGLDRPFEERKKIFNLRAEEMIKSDRFEALINTCENVSWSSNRLSDMRMEMDMLELRRLLCLSTIADLWRAGSIAIDWDKLAAEVASPCPQFNELGRLFNPESGPKKILYLPNSSGGLMFDLLVVRSLLRQGHKVILALKEGFYYQAPSFWDYERDPVFSRALADAKFVPDEALTKNQLLATLGRNQFVVISDGTRERLNLQRVSVTFSRAWKESDVILAKGEANHRRLISTGHHFTRDIFCFFRDRQGRFQATFKPKAFGVRKFSQQDLTGKAQDIIEQMREARVSGRAVMFYSGIIGSIPGQTSTAIKVMNTFINYLRSRLEATFIINPAEHFEEGMDGDDLMYMWEMVQRSGLIGVWRFQSVDDIEKSFELMFKKVPPIWAGKDSTYSTGCTKEMHIALDMQQKHPELQIIGPDPEKFFRRREYGVGKYCDVAIDEC